MNAHVQPNELDLIPVSPVTFRDCLLTAVDMNRPLFTWGSPGIGKSDQINALPVLLAAAYDCEPEDILLIDCRASQWASVDTRGIPFTVEVDGRMVTVWAPPGLFPSEKQASKYKFVIIFFDELNTASQAVQAALYQLFLDRALGDYTLPDNVRLFAAGNLDSDRAVTNRMSSALGDRFIHVALGVDNQAWQIWAADNDLHTAVRAFLTMRPELLHQFDPKSPSKSQATPRGWQWTSEALYSMERNGVNGAVREAMVLGKLGNSVGREFLAFLDIFNDCPDPRDFIADPLGAELPREVSQCCALCNALAKQANKRNLKAIMQFAERIGQERGVEFMTLLTYYIDVDLRATKAFTDWAQKHQDVYFS